MYAHALFKVRPSCIIHVYYIGQSLIQTWISGATWHDKKAPSQKSDAGPIYCKILDLTVCRFQNAVVNR